jgi:hypothetical protein
MLLGVANTMLMSVIERTREIGTMMAVGVRRSKILGLFVMEALTIGALGGFLGAAAGSRSPPSSASRGLTFTFPARGAVRAHARSCGPAYLLEVLVLATAGAGICSRSTRLPGQPAATGGGAGRQMSPATSLRLAAATSCATARAAPSPWARCSSGWR